MNLQSAAEELLEASTTYQITMSRSPEAADVFWRVRGGRRIQCAAASVVTL